MIQELVEAAAGGDSQALRKLVELAAQGNEEALDALERGLKKAAEEAEDPDLFLADLKLAKSAASSAPGAAEECLKALAVRARRLGSCERVQVLGLDAGRLMVIGALDDAGHRLSQARALEVHCREGAACALLNRRRGVLLARYRGDLQLALREAEEVMKGYKELSGPGHDLNGDGLASSYIARAEVRFHLGDHAGSAADCADALTRFPPSAPVWRITQQNLASALAQTAEGRREVLESRQFAALRLSMRNGETIERASFLWLDGQLWLTQEDKRPDRGFKRLHRAMKLFAHPKISAPEAFLNVTSDIVQAKISRDRYPDRGEIAAFLEEEVGPLAAQVITHDLHHERLRDLHRRCKSRPTLSVWLDVRLAVESLRAAAERSIPCLLGWPGWLNPAAATSPFARAMPVPERSLPSQPTDRSGHCHIGRR